jgi:hypothetical protein
VARFLILRSDALILGAVSEMTERRHEMRARFLSLRNAALI